MTSALHPLNHLIDVQIIIIGYYYHCYQMYLLSSHFDPRLPGWHRQDPSLTLHEPSAPQSQFCTQFGPLLSLGHSLSHSTPIGINKIISRKLKGEIGLFLPTVKMLLAAILSVLWRVSYCTPGGATYIPLHVVFTDQTLSFFTQNTDMPKD